MIPMPLKDRMVEALTRLEKNYYPHPCGGFTTDDMQWAMGTAFILQEDLYEAIDELMEAKVVRYAGLDENDAIGHCYELIKKEGV